MLLCQVGGCLRDHRAHRREPVLLRGAAKALRVLLTDHAELVELVLKARDLGLQAPRLERLPQLLLLEIDLLLEVLQE